MSKKRVIVSNRRRRSNGFNDYACGIWLLLFVPLLWWYRRVQKVTAYKDEV